MAHCISAVHKGHKAGWREAFNHGSRRDYPAGVPLSGPLPGPSPGWLPSFTTMKPAVCGPSPKAKLAIRERRREPTCTSPTGLRAQAWDQDFSPASPPLSSTRVSTLVHPLPHRFSHVLVHFCFPQQTFLEHLLEARTCPRCWRLSRAQAEMASAFIEFIS